MLDAGASVTRLEKGQRMVKLNYDSVSTSKALISEISRQFLVDTKHLGHPGWYLCLLQNPINRAGVPLFFMISGFLLLQDPAIHTPLSFYRRRLPRLLLPLAVWNGIYLLLRTRPDSFRSGLADYFRTLLTTGSCYHMWFLYTILGIYLVAPVLGFLAQHGGRSYLMILLAVAVFPTSILL